MKSHFYISTQELYNAIILVEKATKERASKKRKTKGKEILEEAEIDGDTEEEAEDESESEIGDCIIIDVE